MENSHQNMQISVLSKFKKKKFELTHCKLQWANSVNYLILLYKPSCIIKTTSSAESAFLNKYNSSIILSSEL